MRKYICMGLTGFFALAILSGPVFAQEIKRKDLPQKYQDFLDLTEYIMMEEEREVFMQLQTNRDRDIFMETFWAQRDPTPGTTANEYKQQHIQRFHHANQRYGRSTVREGWKTDQGRIYITLGEPHSVERFISQQGIYPTEVWYYYGDKEKSLPPHFAILFYKRSGIGEFQLYDWVSDGPSALLVDGSRMDSADYQTLYEKIRELAPTLSLVSHSLVPGDIPYNYQPSPVNNIIMADILESPKKDVNPKYATHFLDYKGIVSSEYMTNYIESETQLAIVQDPLLGLKFAHFSMAPKEISVDYYEPKDQYFCNFSINVSLRKTNEDIVFQYTKEFPFYFSPDKVEKVQNNGIAIEDSFPIAEGTYKFIVLLQNSVGKEFSVFETDITIPENPHETGIDAFLVGYDSQKYSGNLHIPFKIMDTKLLIDPKNTFSVGDSLHFLVNMINVNRNIWETGCLKIHIQGMKSNLPDEKNLNIPLTDFSYNSVITVNQQVDAGQLTPDYYEISVDLLKEDGTVLDSAKFNLIISPEQAMGHPMSHTKAFSHANRFVFYLMLANQYDKSGQAEKAESFYQRIFEIRPDYVKAILDYSHFLIGQGKYQKGLEVIERLKAHEDSEYDYYFLKGKTLMRMGQYVQAIDFLLEGNKIYNSDIELLNALGFCYHRTGQDKKALDVLQSSLELNNQQPEVQALVEEIRSK
jgi:GWxTD domain-containing protein